MVRVEDRDDAGEGVLLITLDRPERRNAVDLDSLVQLVEAQRIAARCRVVVLTGEPPAFCAGADLNGVENDEFVSMLRTVLIGFTTLSQPVVAAVDGPALGAGTQLVSVCDLRVATPTSRFGIPAARLGLTVDAWTVDRLSREFGAASARAMLIAAETFTGEQLAGSGAIHRLGGLDDALTWAGEISRLAPLTIAAHKLALETRSTQRSDEHAQLVNAASALAWASDDVEEGRVAFMQKRPPRFRGR